jgi:c-di-GMP-related signal transduction protein
MAASLSAEQNLSLPDTCFMAGLFSVLDIALDLPMVEVLEGISLSSEITAALTSREGPVGEILQAAREAEIENWAGMVKFKIDPERARRLYLEATQWAESRMVTG